MPQYSSGSSLFVKDVFWSRYSLESVNPLYKSAVTSGYIYLCTKRSLFQKQSGPKAFHVPIDLKPHNGYFCTHWRPI